MRNSILQSALSVSLESDDLPMEGAELNPVTETTTVQVDEVLEEVREAGDAVEEHEEAVEELDGAAESLESLITSLESAIADGGMSPQTADVHSRAMANAVRRLPIDASQFTVSNESFGGTGDKLVASQEALEGAKEMLSKIWNAIKNAVIGAWKAVVNFVQTIGKSAAALNKAGKLLIASANSAKGNAKGKKIDATGVAKLLHVNGDFDGNVAGKLATIVSNGAKVVNSAKVAQSELTKLAGAVASGMGGDENVGTGDAIYKALPQGALPGGREIEEQEKGGYIMPKLVAKVDLKLAKVELDVPDANAIKGIGQGIIKIAQFIDDYDKKYFKGLQKTIDDFVNKQDKLIQRMELEKEETQKVRKQLNDFKKISSIARAVGPDYLGYAASAAKASFNYGKKALAALGGKAEAATA